MFKTELIWRDGSCPPSLVSELMLRSVARSESLSAVSRRTRRILFELMSRQAPFARARAGPAHEREPDRLWRAHVGM